jgi:hypothetical protein
VVLQTLGQQPSVGEVRAMIDEIDMDGNGQLEVKRRSRPSPSPPLALPRSCLVRPPSLLFRRASPFAHGSRVARSLRSLRC